MEMKLVEAFEVDDRKVARYEIGDYKVKDLTYSWGHRVEVSTRNRERYLPDIYCRTDDEGVIVGFEVQTTSYGALAAEEIKKVIAGLEEAVQVVEILTVKFVEKEGRC